MKIVQKRSQRKTAHKTAWIAVIGVIAVVILIISQTNTGLFLPVSSTLRALIPDSNQEELPVLTIDMPFGEYDRILSQREEALSAGVVMLSEQDFVRADIRFQEQTIPVEMRLQQGSAVHLDENDKWNFDVRTRNNQLLSGMQRFYLIDPGDNNWLNEAAFAQALRREGLIAGQYQFVQLFLNGEDKGIYALQEGFGAELLKGNGREEGVIVEFDATPFWEALAYYEGNQDLLAGDPVSNFSASDFQFFEVDTFRDATIADDEELTSQKNQAIGLLRGLQSGELAAADVFDVQKYGRFLALTDLWGAIEATSLVNLRYYFNPTSNRLEPIGFNGDALASNKRLPFAAFYNDFEIQKAYIEAADKMSTAGYLTELQAELGPEIVELQQTLSKEVELILPWELLEERREQIARSLSPLQPVPAYLGPPSLAQDGIIQVDVANALNLPVELLGFDIDGATFLEVDSDWVQKNQDELIFGSDGELFLRAQDSSISRSVRYVRFHIPVTEVLSQDNELDFLQDPTIQLATRIAGLEKIQMATARSGYPDPFTEQPVFSTRIMSKSRLQIPPTTLAYQDLDMSAEQRYEFKLVTEWGSPALGRSWLRLHPEGFRVAHPPRIVNNLYLDTTDLRCFNDNLMGVSDRVKIRLRWYGQPDSTLVDNPILEIKIKKNLLGYKKRQELACTMDLSQPFAEILKLIRAHSEELLQPWLQAALQPTLINHYHREYYISPDGAIRATLDYGLAAYNQRLDSRPNLYRSMPAKDALLIEVKGKPQDHERLQRAMGFFPIQRGRNSKYVNGLSGEPL